MLFRSDYRVINRYSWNFLNTASHTQEKLVVSDAGTVFGGAKKWSRAIRGAVKMGEVVLRSESGRVLEGKLLRDWGRERLSLKGRRLDL